MSNELLPCPYCGEEPQPRGTRWVMCVTEDCPNRASAFTPEEWNRRFVCLDKNGNKVFAGDDFWFESFEVEGITSYKLDEQERGCFAWMPTYGRWGIDIDNAIVWYDGPLSDLHIELIKEDT